jgi:FixJ family two-component response regulator
MLVGKGVGESCVIKRRPVIGIVDDDVSFREALADLVESFGFPAVSFSSAQDFLLATCAAHLQCLITDVQMPGMDGLELQAYLNASGRNLPIVFVTGYPDPQVKVRALKAGAVGLLAKPFETDDLLRHLMTALNIAFPSA